MEKSNFVDQIKIFCRSGQGGLGSKHLMRNRLTAKGAHTGGEVGGVVGGGWGVGVGVGDRWAGGAAALLMSRTGPGQGRRCNSFSGALRSAAASCGSWAVCKNRSLRSGIASGRSRSAGREIS